MNKVGAILVHHNYFSCNIAILISDRLGSYWFELNHVYKFTDKFNKTHYDIVKLWKGRFYIKKARAR